MGKYSFDAPGYEPDGECPDEQNDMTGGFMMFAEEVAEGILMALERRAAALQNADPQKDSWYEVEEMAVPGGPEGFAEVGLTMAEGPVTVPVTATILRLKRHGTIIKGAGRERTYLMKLDREDSGCGPRVRATILGQISSIHMSQGE